MKKKKKYYLRNHYKIDILEGSTKNLIISTAELRPKKDISLIYIYETRIKPLLTSLYPVRIYIRSGNISIEFMGLLLFRMSFDICFHLGRVINYTPDIHFSSTRTAFPNFDTNLDFLIIIERRRKRIYYEK